MPSKNIATMIDLQARFDGEYAHVQDITEWFEKVLEAIWKAANEELLPQEIRPFLTNFQRRIKSIPLPTPSEHHQL